MFGDIGWEELVLTLAILALLFGAGRVADIGAALGRGIRQFREEVRDDEPAKRAAAGPVGAAQAALPRQERMHQTADGDRDPTRRS